MSERANVCQCNCINIAHPRASPPSLAFAVSLPRPLSLCFSLGFSLLSQQHFRTKLNFTLVFQHFFLVFYALFILLLLFSTFYAFPKSSASHLQKVLLFMWIIYVLLVFSSAHYLQILRTICCNALPSSNDCSTAV